MAEEGFDNPDRNSINEQTAKTYLKDLGLDWKDLKGKKVLDIGAGLAGFAQTAQKQEIDVVSIDAHPEWWEGNIPKNVPFTVGDGKQLPFKPEEFDVVIARAAVHSMAETTEDLEIVLKEIKRVLKPGGEFRFGPGSINTRPLRQDEWNIWYKLLAKVKNKEEITTEEDAWGAKVFSRIEQEEQEHKDFDKMSKEQRMAKLSELSLDRLQNIDPTITVHVGNKSRERYLDTYYLMKKPTTAYRVDANLPNQNKT